MSYTQITTLLVASQIVRVTQNAIQLKKCDETDRDNKEILRMWKRTSRDVAEIKKQLESRQ